MPDLYAARDADFAAFVFSHMDGLIVLYTSDYRIPAMPLLSLSESLARMKHKLKQRLSTGITNKTPCTGSVSRVWPSVTTLLSQLESSAEPFGPLKSAIGRAAKKIDKVLKDLSTHMRSPAEGMMTDSVKLICSEIEAEVSALGAKQGLSTGRRLVDAMDGLDEVMECCQRVHDHLERLTLNLNLNILQGISEQMLELKLDKMKPSMSAVYNSAEAADIKRGACTEGTREAQIKLLLEWADEPSSGRTCWMNGMAGTGKTTIAYTVCTELKSKNQLGASFFCSRTIPECRRVKHIVPSIAYQLARFSLPFRCALSKALSADIDAHALALNVQYKKLIEDPLAAVKDCLPSDLIVVIDALDECDNEDSVGQILELLMPAAHTLPIRFLISSRPEKEITRKMAGRLDGHDDARLVLHNLDSAVVRQDIETYMRKELQDIPLTHAQWRSIVDRCGMLFIYAATTCRYIKQEHEMHNLATAVSVIMNSASVPMEQGDESVIDELYKTILDTAFNRSRASQGNKRRMRMVLETAVCAIEPMTKIAMAKILNLDGDTQVDRLLLPFRSVLNVAQKTGLVTTLHASFPDFMLSQDRSGEYHCQSRSRHATIAEACLRLIDGAEPKFNICALPSSFLLDDQVNDLAHRVTQSISPGLVYACLYWTTHLTLGEHTSSLTGLVDCFFQSRLLLWMEVMNLTRTYVMRHLSYRAPRRARRTRTCHKASPRRIPVRIDLCQPFRVPKHSTHLRFHASVLAPISATLGSIHSRTSGLVQPTGTAIDRRRLALIATWKVSTQIVWSMVCQETEDDLWHLPQQHRGVRYDDGRECGQPCRRAHKDVDYVAISPDGSRWPFLAIMLLPDGVSGGYSLAFSPDGSRVACGLENGRCTSAHWDKSQRSWSTHGVDVQTGQPVGTPFEGHTGQVWSVCSCPTDSRIASGSLDKTIRVWDPQTGQTVLGPLTGHSNAVYCVAFSHNGAFIASGSDDNTIRVYDTRTGHSAWTARGTHQLHQLGHLLSRQHSPVLLLSRRHGTRMERARHRYLQSSSDCLISFLLSTPSDTLAAAHGLSLAQQMGRYTCGMWRPVSWCSDHSMAMSAIRQHTANLGWTDGTRLPRTDGGHSNGVTCVRFSPDSTVVVSGSNDGTVRVWDVSTGQQVTQLFQGDRRILSVGTSPDGHRVVCGLDDSKIVVLDRHSGTTLVGPIMLTRTGFVRWSSPKMASASSQVVVLSVSFSPNGLYVASGSSDHTVRVWDSENGKLIHGPLKAHTGRVSSIQFSPDGSHLVRARGTAPFDSGTYRFWEHIHKRTQPQVQQVHCLSRNPSILSGRRWLGGGLARSTLLWVPSDLYGYLALPSTSSIIADQGAFVLNTDGWKIGDRWMECYRP
ncbi:WD40 repeat-like protein [Rhizoctonia solani]|uniref:WD40 repeat-like protein n=1 Tax=Rhizoctonia solani TaxID=456999 RepID=A0A8H7M1X2_9AGAM|nr:WD40 repeat-like protein [Rhizoctonia solani]